MLEYIRNHVGGLVGVLIIGALSFVFTVAFGQQNQGWGKGSTEDDLAISVGSGDINMATFNYNMALNSNRDYAADSPEYAALKGKVQRALIERQILINMAEAAGVTASTDEAENNILKGKFYVTRSIEQLVGQLSLQLQFGSATPQQVANILIRDGHVAPLGNFTDKNGQFDKKRFDNVVRYQLGFKEPLFIEEQRLELVAQRMRALLLSGVTVADEAVRAQYEAENNTVTLNYIKVAKEMFNSVASKDAAAVDTWKQAHQEEIKQYYETNKYKYTNVEKSARARHILIKVDKEADDATRAAAKAKIDALAARVAAGEDFATLAKENSEDTGSAIKGGDLGYNPKGVMVPAFDDVMFSLKKGAVSDVVKTEFGYHIIKLEDIREGNISLETATPEIAEKLYLESRGAELAKQTADQLQAALQSGADINDIVADATDEADVEAADVDAADAEAADAGTESAPEAGTKAVSLPDGVSLQVQKTAPFSKSEAIVPGIGKSAALVDAAFGLTDQKKTGPKVFEVNGNLFVVQLAERKTPTDDDFAEKKDAIKNQLLSKTIVSWMRDKIGALVDDAMKNEQVRSTIAVQLPQPTAAPATAPGGGSSTPAKK